MPKTKLSPAARQQIESTGFGISGDIGGQPKQRYWTPDGREILSAPSMREFIYTDSKGNTRGGLRDANFDKGWLAQRPEKPKPYCPHCRNWHDTAAEVKKCGAARRKMMAKYSRMGKKELGKDQDNGSPSWNGKERLDRLEGELAEIKDMLKQVLPYSGRTKKSKGVH